MCQLAQEQAEYDERRRAAIEIFGDSDEEDSAISIGAMDSPRSTDESAEWSGAMGFLDDEGEDSAMTAESEVLLPTTSAINEEALKFAESVFPCA